ncbi:unnamed protein product [Arctia plantaginis]|uniref:Uncharacterized protein n=1 Tax=Arctia plantaginis TaxID=874455 RepID=A0A8S0Z3X9_ARCPL|nr:unnamed protein product [Arctia plantaginis]
MKSFPFKRIKIAFRKWYRIRHVPRVNIAASGLARGKPNPPSPPPAPSNPALAPNKAATRQKTGALGHSSHAPRYAYLLTDTNANVEPPLSPTCL